MGTKYVGQTNSSAKDCGWQKHKNETSGLSLFLIEGSSASGKHKIGKTQKTQGLAKARLNIFARPPWVFSVLGNTIFIPCKTNKNLSLGLIRLLFAHNCSPGHRSERNTKIAFTLTTNTK